eukprot:scaffold68237_cov69-Phaeocystis_antarctica.AAC.1
MARAWHLHTAYLVRAWHMRGTGMVHAWCMRGRSRLTLPWARAARTTRARCGSSAARASHAPSHRRSAARSLVPATRQPTAGWAASSSARSTPSGVSIMHHSWTVPCAQPRRAAWASTVSMLSIRSALGSSSVGGRVPSGKLGPPPHRASMSSRPHALSPALMRTTSSRLPYAPLRTASAICRRASSLLSGATASSRSRTRVSAGRALALSSARRLEPGI